MHPTTGWELGGVELTLLQGNLETEVRIIYQIISNSDTNREGYAPSLRALISVVVTRTVNSRVVVRITDSPADSPDWSRRSAHPEPGNSKGQK